MSAPVKFLFDVEFDRKGGRSSAETRAAAQAAEADAYRRGQAAAEAEAHARIERRLGSALAASADKLAEVSRQFIALETRLETEAVEVAVAVARKLAPALTAREPLAEIEALVVDVLAHVRAAPHLVVRLPEDLVEPAGVRLTDIAQRCGFSGKLVFLPAPDLKGDDVRIEWADGGVERDRALTEERIAEAVARYLARGMQRAADTDSESEQ